MLFEFIDLKNSGELSTASCILVKCIMYNTVYYKMYAFLRIHTYVFL